MAFSQVMDRQKVSTNGEQLQADQTACCVCVLPNSPYRNILCVKEVYNLQRIYEAKF